MTELNRGALTDLQHKAESSLASADSAAALEKWRVEYIGRSGQIPLLLRQVKDVPAEERGAIGQAANQLRQILTTAYETKLASLQPEKTSAVKKVKNGTTKLAGLPEVGHLHPLTLTMRRINDIFSRLGFSLYEGPLVDEVKYSFDLLNMPPNHPARAESDSFYTTTGQVLRVQTSALQVRIVEENQLRPPFKLFFPGRVFRNERTDATHETTFHQFEGINVSENTTIADFKGIIEYFYSEFFGKEVTIRLRPSYFPFVEPGFEVDMSCVFCEQQGCRVCKYTGWVEVMGAGMVHPVVLTNMGIDPAKYQGYAFGGAVDRLTMLEYGISDIRLLWSGDLRFLRQFS